MKIRVDETTARSGLVRYAMAVLSIELFREDSLERGGCGPRGNVARGMELGLNRRGGGRYGCVFIACNYVDFFVDTAV